MKIDGIEYELVTMELDDPFDRCDALKKGQAVRYFDKYIYKTYDGKAKACYADDTNNNWNI